MPEKKQTMLYKVLLYSFTAAEDFDLCLRLCLHYRIALIISPRPRFKAVILTTPFSLGGVALCKYSIM